MNIVQAAKDPNLFKPFIGEDLTSWHNWFAALRVLYGLPVRKPASLELIKKCTGRDINLLPKGGFDTALFLVGRRSGKSKIAAIIGAFEAGMSGREKLLSKGEMGVVAVIAPTRKQGRIVKNYLRAIFDATSLLRNEIESETQEGFLLSNGVLVEILVGDWRAVRGYTLLAAIVDEIAFFGLDAESKVRSDTELIRAVTPSLATCQGKLICIGSPYAKKGWSYQQYKKNFGNNNGKVLVWNSPSRTMNPTISQYIIDAALEEDRQAALSEYMGQFRDDVCIFLPREVIESVVVKGRKELLPNQSISYFGFADVSGGRSDDAALAIGHKNASKVIIDFIQRYKPPHSPYQVIGSMSEELRRYGIKKITGDNYSAEFVKQAFQSNGIAYQKSELPKSQLYLELLPRICSGEIELLDDEISINQLASLERRTRSGGKDIIDHPQGGMDDIANAIAGVACTTSAKQIIIGGLFRDRNKMCI